MAYTYGWDGEPQRYELRTLWFLLGVMVFAFGVLIVASIVDNAGSGGAYLMEPTIRQEQTAPVSKATPASSRPASSRGATS